MKLHIVKFVDHGPDLTDGGSIFDRRLVEALIRQGADVTEEQVARKRMIALPIWRAAVGGGSGDDTYFHSLLCPVCGLNSGRL